MADGVEFLYIDVLTPTHGLKFHFNTKFQFQEVWRAAYGTWFNSTNEELARMNMGLPAIAPDGDRDLRVDAMRLIETIQQLTKMYNAKRASE